MLNQPLLKSTILLTVALPFMAAGQQSGRPMSGAAWDYDASVSYTADSDLKYRGQNQGEFSTTLTRARLSRTFSTGEDLTWSVGPHFEYGNFDAPAAAPIPTDVYATAIAVSSTWRMNERWAFTFNIRPGLYSDMQDITWDDFNAPALLIAGYRVNPDLLVALGLNLNFRSDIATIGGPGVWWRFADNWTLNLFLPKPTLEYALAKNWEIYGGGEWRSGAYRVSEDFGTEHGEPGLDDNDFSYRELRGLGGIAFRPCRSFRLAIEGGYAFQRKAEFRQADATLKGDGSPFIQILAAGQF